MIHGRCNRLDPFGAPSPRPPRDPAPTRESTDGGFAATANPRFAERHRTAMDANGDEVAEEGTGAAPPQARPRL